MLYLLTSPYGFIGSRVRQLLEAHGADVHPVDLKGRQDLSSKGIFEDLKRKISEAEMMY